VELSNRTKFPKKSVTVPVGHSKAMRSNEILIIKYQPKAKKFVHIISTIHNEQEILVNLRGRNAQEYKPLPDKIKLSIFVMIIRVIYIYEISSRQKKNIYKKTKAYSYVTSKLR
jgi:hypothetical protein